MFHSYLYNFLEAFNTAFLCVVFAFSSVQACFSAPLLGALTLFFFFFHPGKSFPPGSHYVSVVYECGDTYIHTRTHTDEDRVLGVKKASRKDVTFSLRCCKQGSPHSPDV